MGQCWQSWVCWALCRVQALPAYHDLSPDWNLLPYLGILNAHSINRKCIIAASAAAATARAKAGVRKGGRQKEEERRADSQWLREICSAPWRNNRGKTCPLADKRNETEADSGDRGRRKRKENARNRKGEREKTQNEHLSLSSIYLSIIFINRSMYMCVCVPVCVQPIHTPKNLAGQWPSGVCFLCSHRVRRHLLGLDVEQKVVVSSTVLHQLPFK